MHPVNCMGRTWCTSNGSPAGHPKAIKNSSSGVRDPRPLGFESPRANDDEPGMGRSPSSAACPQNAENEKHPNGISPVPLSYRATGRVSRAGATRADEWRDGVWEMRGILMARGKSLMMSCPRGCLGWPNISILSPITHRTVAKWGHRRPK